MTFDKVGTLVPWACVNWELYWDYRQAIMGYWLDVGQLLLCVLCSWTSSPVFMDRGEVKGDKHVKKECGQYPTI